MSRGAHKFKQGDVTKATKGVVNAGLPVRASRSTRNREYHRLHGRPDDKGQANEWDDVQ